MGVCSPIHSPIRRGVRSPLGNGPGLTLPRTGLLFSSRLPNTEDILWDEEALFEENMFWGGWILPVECYAYMEHDDGFWFSDSTTPVARTGEEILAWPWINTGNIEFSLAAGLSVRWNRVAYYKSNSIVDSDGANTRTLYGLQYIHLTGSTDFTNASIVGTETVTSQPAGTAVITVAAGKLTIAAGDLWSFALSNGSTYEFGTILTATTGVVFDTSGNGRHLLFTVADTSVICLSGREKGSDWLAEEGYSNRVNLFLNSGNLQASTWTITNGAARTSANTVTFAASSNSRLTTHSSGHLPAKAGEKWRVSVKFSNLSTANKLLHVGISETVTPYNETAISYTSSGSGFITVERTVANDCGLLIYVGNISSSPGGVTIDSIVAERITNSLGGLFSIGDSICDSAVEIGPVTYKSQSYTNLFCSNNSVPFLNKGVGGETLVQCAARFSSQVGTPNTVFIEGGINDISAASSDPNATMQSSMSAMVAAAKLISSVKNIYVFSVTPYGGMTAGKIGWVNTYNAWLESFASAQGIGFIDLPSILLVDGVHIAEYFSADTTHPNIVGQSAIAAHLQNVVVYSGDIINPTVTTSMKINKPQPAVSGIVDAIGNSLQYPGQAKLNITPISNPDDSTLTPGHTYNLADSHQMRTALGWTWGVDHWAYTDAGVPKVVSYETMVSNGVGPRCYVGTKGAAVYEVDMDTAPADKDAKIKKYLKVTA